MNHANSRNAALHIENHPSFIMKHIHVGSDTYNPTLIFSDVLTRLTSHIKSKEPNYKTLHIIVSTALLKIKEKKSHCY